MYFQNYGQAIFSEFFSAFLKSTLNFQHFQKKDGPHSQCVFKTTNSEEAH